MNRTRGISENGHNSYIVFLRTRRRFDGGEPVPAGRQWHGSLMPARIDFCDSAESKIYVAYFADTV